MTRRALPRLSMPTPVPATLALLLTAALLAASTRLPVVLTGTVTDSYSGQPVPEASVVIGDTPISTDAQGVFRTPQWRKSDTLSVAAPNYEPLSLALEGRPELAATDAQTITLDTAIRPN